MLAENCQEHLEGVAFSVVAVDDGDVAVVSVVRGGAVSVVFVVAAVSVDNVTVVVPVAVSVDDDFHVRLINSG